MARSKFRSNLRKRPKEKVTDDDGESSADSFAAGGRGFFKSLERVLSPFLWALPFVMMVLFVAASQERGKCKLCHSPTGNCEDLTTGFWDSRSFKSEEYKPFAGRFDGETVFETSEITCKMTGVDCEWKSGDFGAQPAALSCKRIGLRRLRNYLLYLVGSIMVGQSSFLERLVQAQPWGRQARMFLGMSML